MWYLVLHECVWYPLSSYLVLLTYNIFSTLRYLTPPSHSSLFHLQDQTSSLPVLITSLMYSFLSLLLNSSHVGQSVNDIACSPYFFFFHHSHFLTSSYWITRSALCRATGFLQILTFLHKILQVTVTTFRGADAWEHVNLNFYHFHFCCIFLFECHLKHWNSKFHWNQS